MSAATPPAKRSKKRTMQLRLLLFAFAIGFATCTAEVALQLAPGLLPTSYRERFPPHGVEFFHPGLLDATRIEDVPLPFGIDAYDGAPPSDLVGLGVAPPRAAELDRETTPRIRVPADDNGMPNATPVESPDVAFIGDSFTVFASQREPAGLQRRVEEATGKQILNLSVSGLGPDRELFLLKRLALPKKPKLVVWFFFGGNDITDAVWMSTWKQQGIDTYGQLFAERRAPSLLLPSLIGSWFDTPESTRLVDEPFPALRTKQDGTELWMHPDVLRVVSVPEVVITQNPGWVRATAALRAAQQATSAAGAKLLMVFLPCKAHVYLPLIEPDKDLLHRMAQVSTFAAIPVPDDSNVFLQSMLQNRHAIEESLSKFCHREGIRFWSARPAMEDAAATRSELLYYRADTHWRPLGQQVVAEALIAYLQQQELLK